MNSSILIGNGINRSFNSNYISFEKLLEKLNRVDVKGMDKANIPFTLQVVLGTGNEVHECIKDLADILWGMIPDEKTQKLYKSLLELPVRDIFTLNYGFELEEAACGIIGKKISSSGVSRITDYQRGYGLSRSESNMFIYTHQAVRMDGREKRIWHLHGHAKNPSSMLIGHYYYGNMLSKIQTYLQKAGNRYKWAEDYNSPNSFGSWIDSFILDNVYVLGFGCDFAEMDMWWLLERKNREKAKHGKVCFYEPYTADAELKFKLLDCYGVEVETLGYEIKKNDKNASKKYGEFYRMAIEDIRKKIEKGEK